MFKAPVIAIVFVLGVWRVQHTAALISQQSLLYFFVFISVLGLSSCLILRLQRIRAIEFKRANALKSTPFNIVKFTTKLLSVISVLFCIFSLGFIWASVFAHARLQHGLPKMLEQQSIEIEGVIATQPQLTQYGWRIQLDISNVHAPVAAKDAFNRSHFPKRVSLNYYPNQPNFTAQTHAQNQSQSINTVFNVGERWRMTVSLKKMHSTINPHGFDFEAWAMSERIDATGTIKNKLPMEKLAHFVWQPTYVIEKARAHIQQYMSQTLAKHAHSGLLQALVMGGQNQITPNDWQVMLDTGTTHLMSISGLHISMLSGLMFGLTHFLWRRVPSLALLLPARKAATCVGVVTACLYALIAGFSVPTQRTLYMLLVFAVALWSGRQFLVSQVLAIALVIVVLIDPWAVISAGFWLSFGAVACLAFIFVGRIGRQGWGSAFITSQWAITLGLLPVLLVLFNQVSLISPLANALMIPLVSFVVTPLALIGGFLQLDFLLYLSHFLIEVGMHCLQWLSMHTIAVWQQQAPPSWTLIPAMLGAVWLLLPQGFPLKWFGFVGFLPMFVVMPPRPEIGAMKVTVLDVSQGLSVVVQTHSHTLLYDTGNTYSAQNDAGKSVIVPYLRAEGVRQLDGVMLSHDDTDHVGGLTSILASIPAKWIVASFDASPSISHINIQPTLSRCIAGQDWIWDGVRFEVLYPQIFVATELESGQKTFSSNNTSCVMKVTSQYGSILLTGDIEKQAELRLLNDAQIRPKLTSDVMVVPHHGSKTSSRLSFIQAVSPSAAIFTMGYLNRYHHPKTEVVERYLQENIAVYRSDYHGGITLHFDQDAHIGVSSTRLAKRRYWHQFFE